MHTPPLVFVTWKWAGADAARQFPAEAVNILYAMLTRHYHVPFRLVCLTDDPTGIAGGIDIMPLPQTKADHLQMPPEYKLFPACFRRLWLFSPEACYLGQRICNIDLDVIITGDITGLLTTKTADFVGWSEERFAWNKIAGGIWLLTTGAHPEVWDCFDPEKSPHIAWNQGHRGSDQAWISQCLYPPRQRLTSQDGLWKLAWLPTGGHPPGENIKIVFTSGLNPPWKASTQLEHKWVLDYWHV